MKGISFCCFTNLFTSISSLIYGPTLRESDSLTLCSGSVHVDSISLYRTGSRSVFHYNI